MENRVEHVFRLGVKHFFAKLRKYTPPYTLRPGCSAEVGQYCYEHGLQRVLIVTDATLRALGATAKVEAGLKEKGIAYTIFDRVLPNPTTTMCLDGREMGLAFRACAVVAVGGGSVLDCAKVIAAGLAHPLMDIRWLCTLLVPQKIVPHIAVPTTSGTGSEVSMGVVISSEGKHQKHTGGSPLFTYNHVFLDAELTIGIPPKPTAAFGMDALSHAVESYLSLIDNEEGKAYSIEAIKLIFKYLPIAYQDGTHLEAREQMAYASMRAGCAMNINYAGLAHPLAHALGSVYGLPHGELIAATLLPTLRFEEEACRSKLAQLCVACGFGQEDEPEEIRSQRFIDKVDQLRHQLGLAATIAPLKEEDFRKIERLTFKDAVIYPLPKSVHTREVASLLRQMLPPKA